MDYEEIKQKYAPKVQERARKTSNSIAKIEHLEGMKADAIKARELFRGIMGQECRERWDYYTNRINELNERIEAAKQERDDVQIGDIAGDVFNQMGI